jgi:hypothetical protein
VYTVSRLFYCEDFFRARSASPNNPPQFLKNISPKKWVLRLFQLRNGLVICFCNWVKSCTARSTFQFK